MSALKAFFVTWEETLAARSENFVVRDQSVVGVLLVGCIKV